MAATRLFLESTASRWTATRNSRCFVFWSETVSRRLHSEVLLALLLVYFRFFLFSPPLLYHLFSPRRSPQNKTCLQVHTQKIKWKRNKPLGDCELRDEVARAVFIAFLLPCRRDATDLMSHLSATSLRCFSFFIAIIMFAFYQHRSINYHLIMEKT